MFRRQECSAAVKICRDIAKWQSCGGVDGRFGASWRIRPHERLRASRGKAGGNVEELSARMEKNEEIERLFADIKGKEL